MQFRLPLVMSSLILAFAACSTNDTSAGSVDGGGSDAARTDGSASGDSGGTDAGATDSGGTTDSGGGTDSGGSTDSGGTDSGEAGAQPVNGCGATEFGASDHTAANDPRAITFPADGQAEAQYSIPCMHITAGQTVTWNGGMDAATGHPLEPFGGDTGSPIQLTATGTTVSFTFPAAGVFGFHCANHPQVMLGAIQVTP